MRFPIIRQLEHKDCGATCIQMITQYYGNKVPMSVIKNLCDVTRIGLSVFDLTECMKKLGFAVTASTISFDFVLRAPLPIIIFWRQEHYVVLYKIALKAGKRFFYIADPAYGALKLKEEDFLNYSFKNGEGIIIVMKPLRHFKEAIYVKEESGGPLKKLSDLFVSHFKRNRLKLSLSLVLLLVAIGLNWMIPVLLRKIVDDGIVAKSFTTTMTLLMMQLVFFGSYSISNAMSTLVLTKMNFTLSLKYIGEYLYKLLRLPIKIFDNRLNTDLINRMEDQERIQGFLTYKGIEILIALINLVVFSCLLFYYSKLSFLVFLFLSVLTIVWSVLFLEKRKRLEYDRFYMRSENKNTVYEIVNGMPEIKLNAAEESQIAKWEKSQSKLNNISLSSLYLNYYQITGGTFFNKLRDIIIMGICAYFIISSNDLTIGTMMTISYILGQLSGPVSQLTGIMSSMQDTVNSIERLEEIQKKEDEDNTCKVFPPVQLSCGIKVTKVHFKYINNASKYVINDVSFNIPRGKVTAIVGASGCGKTTLVKLLLSFYYPQLGDIYLDGVKLSEINSHEWRKMCGVVMQNGYIFSGTVAENIALAELAPDMERVRNAAKLACIDDFVETLPMKYQTKIGKVGLEISGGQRQRILIARAIYKNPQFIILDEATSSLDANNERLILKNLDEFFHGKTVVIVAHRLSTVKNADNIIVMDRGRIVEQGTHEKLAHARGLYYELVRNQLELGN